MGSLKPFLPTLERHIVYGLGRQDPLTAAPGRAEFRVERVNADNVLTIVSFRDDDVADIFRQYLAENDIGVYAYSDCLAVGHAWAAMWHGSKRRVWGYLPVDAGTAVICFCSVSHAFRGRRIFQSMLIELVRLVFESVPVRCILIDVVLDNLPSRAAIERVGFRRLLVLPVVRWRGHAIPLRRIPDPEPANLSTKASQAASSTSPESIVAANRSRKDSENA